MLVQVAVPFPVEEQWLPTVINHYGTRMAENCTGISVKRVDATLQEFRRVEIVAGTSVEERGGRQVKDSREIQCGSDVLFIPKITNSGVFGLVVLAELCCPICRCVVRNNDFDIL
jgi:hypothetical protein